MRARAAEALGYMRYYPAQDALIVALEDPDADVRRNAVISLGWCGGREALGPLADLLEDADWSVRQSARVALTNLTGMDFPFDALADQDRREAQAEVWSDWIDALPEDELSADILELTASDNYHERERGVRAAGALGGENAAGFIIEAIERWRDVDNEGNTDARWLVQAGIRALGRTGDVEALPVLKDFLDNLQWARYAADALGDFGGEEAAAALLEALPLYAPQSPGRATAQRTHPTDRPGFQHADRILVTPYNIAFALSRINFRSSGNIDLLRENSRYTAALIPLDFDGLVAYSEEPYQRIVRHLLEEAGMNQLALDAVFDSLSDGLEGDEAFVGEREHEYQHMYEKYEAEQNTMRQWVDNPQRAATWLTALSRGSNDIPRVSALLDHPNYWVRINAAKTLAFSDAAEAVDEIGHRLEESKPEAAHGFFYDTSRYFTPGPEGYDEFDDVAPRYREAFVMALGKLDAQEYVPLLIDILFDDMNALEIQYRAANALDMICGPEAVEALLEAESSHPYHSVRIVAREALWRRGEAPIEKERPERPEPAVVDEDEIPEQATRFVFIKGDHDPYNPIEQDNWRQSYVVTDSGPTYRPGRNIYVLDISGEEPSVTALTEFSGGYVADVEVSYDGREVLFSRRTEENPWWHLYRIGADGTGLEQLTDGPYHDVQPVVMPNGRIAFSSSRLGMRDEYHGYLCTGVATMNPDGSDIQIIGLNFGRDTEPAVDLDGRLIFTRLEMFYSRMKTEKNLVYSLPDGTRQETLYGPERRGLWSGVHGGYGPWASSGERHRQLRLVQAQPYKPGRYLLNTPAGPIITEGRFSERILREDFLRSGGNDPWAVTTPYPLDEDTLLVAAGEKGFEHEGRKIPRHTVDLGIYKLDIPTGELTLVYNDPDTANFEARPLHPRRVPPAISESPSSYSSEFTGKIYSDSVFTTQEEKVPERGTLLRVIEAEPQVTRHQTHTSGVHTRGGRAWKNHGGVFGRVLGTLPLASDGSFAAEVPADRPFHLQVLDSDRNVVGNQLVWMYVRPGEQQGCVGCHEYPGTAAPPKPSNMSVFQYEALPSALPYGDEQFRYQAKMWFKGHVEDEREQRQRGVQSFNLLSRP